MINQIKISKAGYGSEEEYLVGDGDSAVFGRMWCVER
jgi:hypothetical protein